MSQNREVANLNNTEFDELGAQVFTGKIHKPARRQSFVNWIYAYSSFIYQSYLL